MYEPSFMQESIADLEDIELPGMVYSAYVHNMKEQKEMKTARDAHDAHGEAMRHREVIISNRNAGKDYQNPDVGTESYNVTIEQSAMKQLKNSTQL